MQPILQFHNISHKFGKHTIINDVTFAINERDIFGLIGRSGAGKTTLLHILMGLIKPNKGKIFFKGKKVKDLRKHIGFAAQKPSFHPRLTVDENLIYYGKMYGLNKSTLKNRMNHLLELMDLNYAKDVKSENLSGGMARRLDLAIALIHDPEIIILDEPTTGLDIVLRDRIWDLIAKVHKQGKTVIISSHMLHQLQDHCTTFGLLSRGVYYSHKKLFDFGKEFGARNLEEIFTKMFKK